MTSETQVTSGPAPDERAFVAGMVDEVSNALQVILGYAQILHELDADERAAAVDAIRNQSERLREVLTGLTSASRDASGQGPWQQRR
jgi:signal transduction histidine kinase